MNLWISDAQRYREPDDYEYDRHRTTRCSRKRTQHYAPRPQIDGAENITAGQ